MKRATNHRILIGRLVIIPLAVCGAAVGCLLGCAFALVQAGNWLEHSSEATTAHENAALAEASSVLHAMQDSRSGSCSAAEIANFRSLVFRSEYVKDAGRIRGGRIECSAISGHPDRVIGPFRPDFRLSDGTLAYRNLSPIRITGLTRAALQMGSAYAVFDIKLPQAPDPIPMKLAITMKAGDAPRPKSATMAAVTETPMYMTTEGSGLVRNTLYVTRCSDPDFSCVTATTTVSGALHGESGVLPLFATAGAMGGVFWWMGFPFLDSRNRDISRELRRALDQNKLQVYYQPIVNLETRRVVGAEALARWFDRDGKAVDPELFVKVAEDHGFIGLITKAVVKRVLRDFATTLQNHPEFRVSINVGAPDLVDPGFLPMLERSLQKAKVQPKSIVVEITERSAANGAAAKKTISDLRRLGHSIHIDDFGAGFSNLDKLLYLYADTIKIDKAFTKTIGTESVAAVILPHIMTIAKSLNLEVIVEGVEIPYQADYFLPGRQKIYGQGWLFGRPMTAEAFLSKLANNPVTAQAPPERYGVLSAIPGGLPVGTSLTA
jgi:sensor c-di-GMP phosphodiesterase-like protein